jgi:hypothetical protein
VKRGNLTGSDGTIPHRVSIPRSRRHDRDEDKDFGSQCRRSSHVNRPKIRPQNGSARAARYARRVLALRAGGSSMKKAKTKSSAGLAAEGDFARELRVLVPKLFETEEAYFQKNGIDPLGTFEELVGKPCSKKEIDAVRARESPRKCGDIRISWRSRKHDLKQRSATSRRAKRKRRRDRKPRQGLSLRLGRVRVSAAVGCSAP